jgi:hypothetical protein
LQVFIKEEQQLVLFTTTKTDKNKNQSKIPNQKPLTYEELRKTLLGNDYTKHELYELTEQIFIRHSEFDSANFRATA